MPAPQNVLITGATGNQGTAVINALLANPFISTTKIFAVTRNPGSEASQRLAAKSPSIVLIKGDFADCEDLFKQCAAQVDAVYSVQINQFGTPQQHQEEVVQAKNLIDAAVSHKVRHFVQASGDRGGSEKSEWDATGVPHFATKFQIEKYLKEKAGTQMAWTIVRPVTFMENYTPDMHGRGFAAMWHNIGDKPLQFIAAKDIGIVTAKAIAEPESPIFQNKSISLAGDELTQDEGCKAFQKVYGTRMPMIFPFVGGIVQWKIPEVKSMFSWFKEVGYGANVEEYRKIHPGLLNFESWLREESQFKKKEDA